MEVSTRLAIGVLLALGAWGVAYWLTPPREPQSSAVSPTAQLDGYEPPVTFDDRAPDRREGGRDGGAPTAGVPGESEEMPGEEREGAAGTEPGDRVIAPEFVSYVVREGDTPDAISRRFYGTRRHWDAILRANPLDDLHRRLRVGMTIRVPKDPDNVQGRVVGAEESPIGDRSDEPGEGEAEGGAAPPSAIEYTVRRGDTLSEIAQRVYGSAADWTLIRDANREKTGPDGTKIRPGMVLRLPAKPAE